MTCFLDFFVFLRLFPESIIRLSLKAKISSTKYSRAIQAQICGYVKKKIGKKLPTTAVDVKSELKELVWNGLS